MIRIITTPIKIKIKSYRPTVHKAKLTPLGYKLDKRHNNHATNPSPTLLLPIYIWTLI